MLRTFHAKFCNQGRLNKFPHTWQIFPHEKSRRPPTLRSWISPPDRNRWAEYQKRQPTPPPLLLLQPRNCRSLSACTEKRGFANRPHKTRLYSLIRMCKYCTVRCARAQRTACHESGRAKIASGIFSHIFFLVLDISSYQPFFLPSITIRR